MLKPLHMIVIIYLMAIGMEGTVDHLFLQICQTQLIRQMDFMHIYQIILILAILTGQGL